jgi:Reverse transcriptase-like
MIDSDAPRRFHLETDASLNPHDRHVVEGVSLKRAGGGIVLRSPAMRVVGKYTVSLGYLSSPTLAEALVLLKGIRVGRQRHGITVLRARTDCYALILLVSGRGKFHDPTLRSVLEQIVAERDQLVGFEIVWSPSSHAPEREVGVPTADALARKAAGLHLRAR